MKDFAAFLEENKEKAYRLAKENFKYDKHGHALIEPDGDIAKDVFWDDYFNKSFGSGQKNDV